MKYETPELKIQKFEIVEDIMSEGISAIGGGGGGKPRIPGPDGHNEAGLNFDPIIPILNDAISNILDF